MVWKIDNFLLENMIISNCWFVLGFFFFFGLVLCVILMFIFSWYYVLVVIGVVVCIYKYIEYKGWVINIDFFFFLLGVIVFY